MLRHSKIGNDQTVSSKSNDTQQNKVDELDHLGNILKVDDSTTPFVSTNRPPHLVLDPASHLIDKRTPSITVENVTSFRMTLTTCQEHSPAVFSILYGSPDHNGTRFDEICATCRIDDLTYTDATVKTLSNSTTLFETNCNVHPSQPDKTELIPYSCTLIGATPPLKAQLQCRVFTDNSQSILHRPMCSETEMTLTLKFNQNLTKSNFNPTIDTAISFDIQMSEELKPGGLNAYTVFTKHVHTSPTNCLIPLHVTLNLLREHEYLRYINNML